MTRDEKAAEKAAKEYEQAIDWFKLDNIEDGHGQNKKRYMVDAFYSGFYAGRDYQKKDKDGLGRKVHLLNKKDCKKFGVSHEIVDVPA